MNEKLKKIRDELAEQELGDHCYPFIRGFTAAEPHIRQDERERVLSVLRSMKAIKDESDYIEANQLEAVGAMYWADYIEEELKKMDEAGHE